MSTKLKVQSCELSVDGIMKVKKNTKYFLNLEKRHCGNGVISQLKLGENVLVTKDKEILSECESFIKTSRYSAPSDGR